MNLGESFLDMDLSGMSRAESQTFWSRAYNGAGDLLRSAKRLFCSAVWLRALMVLFQILLQRRMWCCTEVTEISFSSEGNRGGW